MAEWTDTVELAENVVERVRVAEKGSKQAEQRLQDVEARLGQGRALLSDANAGFIPLPVIQRRPGAGFCASAPYGSRAAATPSY